MSEKERQLQGKVTEKIVTPASNHFMHAGTELGLNGKSKGVKVFLKV